MYVDDATRLRHMHEAARDAVAFAEGRSRADLERDRMLMHGLVRCLEIIGEAARTTTPERRQAIPSIPWQDVIGLRNRIVHECFRVDLEVVWNTVARDLPALLDALAPILAELDRAAGEAGS